MAGLVARGIGAMALALLVQLPGCHWAQRRGERSPAEKAIAAGDRAFARRAEAGQLDEAISAYLAGLDDEPENPALLWRLARAHTTRAATDPSDEGRGFATGRELGLRCLLASPGFRGLVTAAGGVVTPRAVESVPVDLQPCLLWTGLAWARWLEARGVAGASLDLVPMTALAERALALDPTSEGGLAMDLAGLAAALPPAPLGPDWELAERRLTAAWRGPPPNLTAGVDLATRVYAARGDTLAWRETLTTIASATPKDDDPFLLEQRTAVLRAQQALAAGPPTARWWTTATLQDAEPAPDADPAPPLDEGAAPN